MSGDEDSDSGSDTQFQGVENTDPCTKEGPKTFVEWLKCCSGPNVQTTFRATAGWIFALDSDAMSIARPGEIVPYPYVIVARLAICWCGYFVSTDVTCGKPVTQEDTEAAARVAWDSLSDEKKERLSFETYHETVFMDQWPKAAAAWKAMNAEDQGVFGSFDKFNANDQRENKKSLFTRFGDWSIRLCDSLIADAQASKSGSKADARSRPLLATSFGRSLLEHIKSALRYIFSGAAEWVSEMLQAIFQVMKGSSEFLRGIVKFGTDKLEWTEEANNAGHWVSATYLVMQNLWHIFSQGKLKLGEDPGFKKLFGDDGAFSTASQDIAKGLQKAWEQVGVWNAVSAGASAVIEIPSYFAKTLFLLLVRNFDRFMRDRLAAAIELMRYGLNVCITSRRLKDSSFLWNKQEESNVPMLDLMEYAFTMNGGYRDEFFPELFKGTKELTNYNSGKEYVYTLWRRGRGKQRYEDTAGLIINAKAEEVQTGLMWIRCCLELFNPDLTMYAAECIPFYDLIAGAAGKAMSQFTSGEKLNKYAFPVSTKPFQQLKAMIWPTPLIVRMARQAKSGKYKYALFRNQLNFWGEIPALMNSASKAALKKLTDKKVSGRKRIQCGSMTSWAAEDYVRGKLRSVNIIKNCTKNILEGRREEGHKCYYFWATKTWVCEDCIEQYLKLGSGKSAQTPAAQRKKYRFIDDQGTVLQENPCRSLVPLRF